MIKQIHNMFNHAILDTPEITFRIILLLKRHYPRKLIKIKITKALSPDRKESLTVNPKI